MRLLQSVALVLGALSLVGCGTYADVRYPNSRGPRIYGGVQTDFELEGWLYADVPLSAVGDTVMLPYTGYVAVFGGDDEAEIEDAASRE